MEHEGGIDMTRDKFFKKGIKIMQKEKETKEREEREEAEDRAEEMATDDETIDLLHGKIKREELKKVLFMYLEDDEM
jgi:hypothetical protein